jgi:hypothetical protein
VQAALKTVNQFYAQLRSAVESATSTSQLESSLVGLGKNPELTSATSTLSAYTTSQCGTSTSTT